MIKGYLYASLNLNELKKAQGLALNHHYILRFGMGIYPHKICCIYSIHPCLILLMIQLKLHSSKDLVDNYIKLKWNDWII